MPLLFWPPRGELFLYFLIRTPVNVISNFDGFHIPSDPDVMCNNSPEEECELLK